MRPFRILHGYRGLSKFSWRYAGWVMKRGSFTDASFPDYAVPFATPVRAVSVVGNAEKELRAWGWEFTDAYAYAPGSIYCHDLTNALEAFFSVTADSYLGFLEDLKGIVGRRAFEEAREAAERELKSPVLDLGGSLFIRGIARTPQLQPLDGAGGGRAERKLFLMLMNRYGPEAALVLAAAKAVGLGYYYVAPVFIPDLVEEATIGRVAGAVVQGLDMLGIADDYVPASVACELMKDEPIARTACAGQSREEYPLRSVIEYMLGSSGFPNIIRGLRMRIPADADRRTSVRMLDVWEALRSDASFLASPDEIEMFAELAERAGWRAAHGALEILVTSYYTHGLTTGPTSRNSRL
jgi:hypothetical protein